MKPSRVDRILERWSSVAGAARRPADAPRPVAVRSGLPVATLSGAAVVIVAVAVAAVLLGRPDPNPIAGSSPSAPSSADASAEARASASAPAVGPGRPSVPLACDPADLAARITGWEGAAGSRIAAVEVVNQGASTCLLQAMARPQLVDGHGDVLIDGRDPTDQVTVPLAPGAVARTLVEASNDCKPAPTPPVSVAFLMSDGRRLVAAPVAPDDATVPPCLGSAAPAVIDMHPWAP
jgi:hypothetical protein